jgi:hypothetical protein
MKLLGELPLVFGGSSAVFSRQGAARAADSGTARILRRVR